MSLDFDPNPGTLQHSNPYMPDFRAECIIADKVYASCQQRECFENIAVQLPEVGCVKFVCVIFNPGVIVPGSLVITPIASRPNFARVRFRISIGFTVRLYNKEACSKIEIQGKLPDILKDIIIFMPEARDEFNLQIAIETASRVLSEPQLEDGLLVFPVGVFIIIKVVGRVQLLIPAFGFCPEPPECEEFSPENICIDFETAPFPEFFPRQFEDLPYNELF
jgi:hypothetical protein